MISKLLQNARDYEAQMLEQIPDAERPGFHLTGGCGWINDPNGFSYYKGAYHIFYQYFPYSNSWGSMHWGHAVSEDLLSWKRLPVAMAPDEKYDNFGCFPGADLSWKMGVICSCIRAWKRWKKYRTGRTGSVRHSALLLEMGRIMRNILEIL